MDKQSEVVLNLKLLHVVKRKSLLILSMNLLAILIATYFAGLLIGKHRFGKWILSTTTRDKMLADPENCKSFDCRGFKDFNTTAIEDWEERNDDRLCMLSNPIFGYYNTCSNGKSGLSKETSKEKERSVFRVLLVGGSQANINTIPLEEALKSKLSNFKSSQWRTAEVFGAAIGGGKQPMQIQTANALISLGYEFDAIVNINGWNEIILGIKENEAMGLPVIYPRGHSDRLLLHQRSMSENETSSRCDWLDTALGWHPAYLIASHQCTINRRKNIAKSIDYNQFLERMKLSTFAESTRAAREESALKIWKNSSLNLSAIANANGLKYIEVIQPTLNLGNSKLMPSTKEVAMQCLTVDKPVTDLISSHYIAPASSLLKIPKSEILDARRIFEDSTDDDFIDCVHLSAIGSRKLGNQIAEQLFLEEANSQ